MNLDLINICSRRMERTCVDMPVYRVGLGAMTNHLPQMGGSSRSLEPLGGALLLYRDKFINLSLLLCCDCGLRDFVKEFQRYNLKR